MFFDRQTCSEILNLSYIGTEAEREAFEKEILRRGISDVSDIFASPRYPALKERVMASWERLFDTDGLLESDLQGAVWRLKKEWIKEVEGQENIKE